MLCSSPTRASTKQSSQFLNSYRLAVGVGSVTLALALPAFGRGAPLQCQAERPYATSANEPLPEAESMLNTRDLGFGTVTGFCTGVFLKKGLKAIAFMLGGAFVLLQYLSSRSFISVNWGAMSSSYDSLISRKAGPPSAQGGNRLARLANTFVDFVTANLQMRATFIAGMVLGFRMG